MQGLCGKLLSLAGVVHEGLTSHKMRTVGKEAWQAGKELCMAKGLQR